MNDEALRAANGGVQTWGNRNGLGKHEIEKWKIPLWRSEDQRRWARLSAGNLRATSIGIENYSDPINAPPRRLTKLWIYPRDAAVFMLNGRFFARLIRAKRGTRPPNLTYFSFLYHSARASRGLKALSQIPCFSEWSEAESQLQRHKWAKGSVDS